MKATILIADDDEAIRRALADRLRYWGHAVTEAADGEAAAAEAARKTFDLVILDLAMPGLSGLEVLDRLRESGSRAEKVVLSAYGSLQKVVDAMKRGADDFLTKPADFEILRAVVDRALEKQRLRRVNEAFSLKDAVMTRTPLETAVRVLL